MIRDFVIAALISMIPLYGPVVVRQQTLLWFDRAELTTADIEEIAAAIAAQEAKEQG